MAELNVAAGANRHKGITRSKKLSTRVDLTPMVDLGFLLITFFVFTTTLSQPTTMNLLLPADTGDPEMPLRESTVLTIIPLSNNKVAYYHGRLQRATQLGHHGLTNFSTAGGIGALIRQKQHDLAASGMYKRTDLMLIIRPINDAYYKTVVDALDEVLLNDVKHYSFVDITEDELRFLALHGYSS